MTPLELFVAAGILIGLLGMVCSSFATALYAIKRGTFISGVLFALHSAFWILALAGVLRLLALGDFNP